MNPLRKVRDAIAWRQLGRRLYFYFNIGLAAASMAALLFALADPAPGELRALGFFAFMGAGYYLVRDAWRWWRYGA